MPSTSLPPRTLVEAAPESPTTNHLTIFPSQSKGAVRVAFDITAPEDVGGGGSGVLATFITETSPELFYLTPEERKQLVLQSFVR